MSLVIIIENKSSGFPSPLSNELKLSLAERKKKKQDEENVNLTYFVITPHRFYIISNPRNRIFLLAKDIVFCGMPLILVYCGGSDLYKNFVVS